MLSSMTGFGSAAAEIPGSSGPLSVRVEVRAVNHRYLQVKVRLPGDLAFLEGPVEERCKKRLSRGALSVSVALSRPSAFLEVGLDLDLARAWTRVLADAARALELERGPDLALVVGLPGVLGGQVDESRIQRGAKAVLKVVDDALLALCEMRAQEGAALEADLRKQAGQIERARAQIAKRAPQAVKRHQKSLQKRIDELLGPERTVAAPELARELAVIADRLDVTEELTRLESHAEQLERLLDQGGAIGRKLDFLVQEFHREANTIGSKSNDAGIAHLVVDLKTAIERLREQVQNIE